jgi:nucleotide-binding universal stress UspA family protein
MTKLLVPIDGSDSALRALKFAAKTPQASIFILNVQPSLPSSHFVSKKMIADHQQRDAQGALARARTLVKRLKIDARVYTGIGDPAASIADFAKQHRCNAIVMGSRGQSSIVGLVLGSVATKVIHLAGCPVTVVK